MNRSWQKTALALLGPTAWSLSGFGNHPFAFASRRAFLRPPALGKDWSGRSSPSPLASCTIEARSPTAERLIPPPDNFAFAFLGQPLGPVSPRTAQPSRREMESSQIHSFDDPPPLWALFLQHQPYALPGSEMLVRLVGNLPFRLHRCPPPQPKASRHIHILHVLPRAQ